MKNHFISRTNDRKIVLLLAMGLSIVSALLLQFPSLAYVQTSDDQFCKENASSHLAACANLLKLVGPNHVSSEMQTLLADKNFMQKLQDYEQKSAMTLTPSSSPSPSPGFDTYLFKSGTRVNPAFIPTGGSSDCGSSVTPVASPTPSSETIAFFGSSVTLDAYSFNLKQGCSYQVSWPLTKELQKAGCSYGTGYFKDKMSMPITYQLLPSTDSFVLGSGQPLYTSILESDTTQIVAKFDSTQTATVTVAPFYVVCDVSGTPINPSNQKTVQVGNATLTFTVQNRESNPDGWCTATATANVYNCVLNWPLEVRVYKHNTSPTSAGQLPYCEPSWLSNPAKRETKRYSYSCGFPSGASNTSTPTTGSPSGVSNTPTSTTA